MRIDVSSRPEPERADSGEENAVRGAQRFAVAAALATGMLGASLALGTGSPTLIALGVLAGAAGTGLAVRVVVAARLDAHAQVLQAAAGLVAGDPAARPAIEALRETAGLGENLDALVRAFDAQRGQRTGALSGLAIQIADVERELADLERDRGVGEISAAERAARLEALAERLTPERPLLQGLAELVEETSSSILEMTTSIEEVTHRVDSLHQAVDSSSASVLEISASLEQVGDNADAVEGMAEESAASMVQMDRAIQQVDEHVREASTLTERVAAEAESGSEAMGSTLEGIELIRTVTHEAGEAIERLQARIAQIGAIVGVISDINDETHLLSLNAAIIAAQAGEQGHAFAVVAGHVKTLAQRTAGSTQEIGELIRAVQGETTNVVNAMSSGAEAVATGVERARRAGGALHDIRRAAHDANSRVAEIARAAAEQTRNSAHVTEAAQRTSAMIQQITAAIGEQRRAGNTLRENSEAALSLCEIVRRASAEELQASRFVQERIASISEVLSQIETDENPAGAREALAEAIQEILEASRKPETSSESLRLRVAALRQAAQQLDSAR